MSLLSMTETLRSYLPVPMMRGQPSNQVVEYSVHFRQEIQSVSSSAIWAMHIMKVRIIHHCIAPVWGDTTK